MFHPKIQYSKFKSQKNKSKFKRIVALLTLTIVSATVFAQEIPARHQAQLDNLIATAVRSNPEIQMARYESMSAEAKISPVGQLPDPQLKVAAMNVPTNFSLTSDMTTMFPQFSLMEMFPWFGKLDAAGNVERYGYAASAERLSSVTLRVISEVKKVYGQIYSAEKSIQYQEYKKQLLQSVVKVAEQLFAVGQVPQQDVFRATAELTMVQSDIIKMESMLSDQTARLGALLGQNVPYAIQVDTLPLRPLDSLGLLEARLDADNPDLKQIRNVELAANAKTVFARKDAVPDFSVGISYGYRGTLAADGTKALNMMNLEVGFSLPLFFGSKQQKMIDEADFMDRAAKEQYGAVELDLYSELRSACADAAAQGKLLPLYSNELIPQYEAAYNSSLSSYSVGKTSFAMVIDNLTILINTKIEFSKIEAAYFAATADISRLVGEGADNYGGGK